MSGGKIVGRMGLELKFYRYESEPLLGWFKFNFRRSLMSLTSFISRHSLIALLSLSIFICGSVAIAGTKIQEDMEVQAQKNPKNPHHIPSNMNPKFYAISSEAVVIEDEIRKEAAELVETTHTIAFRGYRSYVEPILDYTTGTSN